MLRGWDLDAVTAAAAAEFPLEVRNAVPAQQFPGRNFNARNWDHRTLQPARWPGGDLRSSPRQIVELFSAGQYLEGLAMVVSSGTMWRQPDAIYGPRALEDVRSALEACVVSVRQTGRIDAAWVTLTGRGAGGLGWSPVTASKTLHFLCRSLGHIWNPPVPIDNAVMLNTVWPAWRVTVPARLRPLGWRGSSLDAYLRYLTAVLVWAESRDWSTTDMEATIFHEYGAKAGR